MNVLMKFDPATGEPKPYPSAAVQYRKYHGEVAWLYNPWTGEKRKPEDIGSDTFGKLICEMEDQTLSEKCMSAFMRSLHKPDLALPIAFSAWEEPTGDIKEAIDLLRKGGRSDSSIGYTIGNAIVDGPDGIIRLISAIKEKRANMKEGLYWVTRPGEREPVLAHGYYCTDIGGKFVYGFNTHDGGGFVAHDHLVSSAKVVWAGIKGSTQ